MDYSPKSLNNFANIYQDGTGRHAYDLLLKHTGAGGVQIKGSLGESEFIGKDNFMSQD